MFPVLICALLGAVSYFSFGSLAKQIGMGFHITQITNVFEELERTRDSSAIRASGEGLRATSW